MSDPSEKVEKVKWDSQWDRLDGRELPPLIVDYDDRNWLDVESIIKGLDLHDEGVLKPKEQATFDKYADALFRLYETSPDAASSSETSSFVLAPGSKGLIPKKHVARSSSVPALRNVDCLSPGQGMHADRSKPIKSKMSITRYESETLNCSGTATEKAPSSPWSKKRKFESPILGESKEIHESAMTYGSVYQPRNRTKVKIKKRKLANDPDDGEWKPGGRSSSSRRRGKKLQAGRGSSGEGNIPSMSVEQQRVE